MKHSYMGHKFHTTEDMTGRFWEAFGLDKKGKEHLLTATQGNIDGWTEKHAYENAKRFIRGEKTRY